MKLYNLLNPDFIKINCLQTDTQGILKEILHELKLLNKISNETQILKKLLEREKLGSTSIGHYSAVPHTKLKELREPVIFVGTSKDGIFYHENDEQPVHFIILILSPNNAPIIHLQILAAAASLIKNSRNLLMEIQSAVTPEALINMIKKYETLDDQD